MRRENSEFITSFVSEAGSLKTNKDYFAYVELDDFACYVVADGLDTDREISAAKLSVEYILERFTAQPSLSKRRLKRFLREAGDLLRRESERVRLKASILVVVTDYMKVRWATAGNTRLYLFRNQKVLLKSKDQSYYQHSVEEGRIPDDGSREYEERHNLLQYLGQPKKLHSFVSKKYKLQDNDILLLASCGLWEQFSDIEFIDAVEAAKDPENFVEDLQEMLLSKKKEEQFVGNFTAAAVFVNKLFKKPDNRRKILTIVLAITIPLLVIGVVVGVLIWRNNKTWTEQRDTVLEVEARADNYTNDRDYDRAQSEYTKAVEEAAELKQTSGKKGKENQTIKSRLDEKNRISQLIADGNKLLEDKNYKKALQSFKDAKRLLDSYTGEEIDENDVNTQDVQAKIERCQTLIDIEERVKLADLQAAGGDYDSALQGYSDALQAAISASESEMEKDINTKLAETQTKSNSSVNSAKKNEGLLLESAGDDSAAYGDYASAVSSYRQAAAVYAAAGYSEGVSSVNGKIAQVEAKSTAEEQSLTQQEEQAQTNLLTSEAQSKEAQGDKYAQQQNYAAAYNAYEEAYDLYIEAGLSEKAQRVAKKMDDVVAKQEKTEQQEQILVAKDWETRAQKALDEGDYATAIACLEQAQSAYQDAGQTDKVLQLQSQIQDVREMKRQAEATPEPTPEPTPTPTPQPTPTPVIIIIPMS